MAKTKSAKLDENFFATNAEEVARRLLGMYLVRTFKKGSVVEGQIHEVAAYEGRSKTAYKGINYAPCVISVSTKYGKNLIDIATGIKDKPSCVTLVSALFDWDTEKQLVQGPGNLSRALRVDRSFDGLLINGDEFWVEARETYVGEIRKRHRKDLPPNCKGYFYIP